jgi:hypothetical protein
LAENHKKFVGLQRTSDTDFQRRGSEGHFDRRYLIEREIKMSKLRTLLTATALALAIATPSQADSFYKCPTSEKCTCSGYNIYVNPLPRIDGSEKKDIGWWCQSSDLNADDYKKFYNKIITTCGLTDSIFDQSTLQETLRKVSYPTSYQTVELIFRILNGEPVPSYLGDLGTRSGYCTDIKLQVRNKQVKVQYNQ